MTEEQSGWIEKAQKSIRAARLLLKDGLFTDATSRAYYAMFYVVTALMLSEGKRYKSHAALISAFHESWIRSGKIDKEFHRYLVNAFDRRNNADYDLDHEEIWEDSEQIIARAEAFLEVGRRKIEGE